MAKNMAKKLKKIGFINGWNLSDN